MVNDVRTQITAGILHIEEPSLLDSLTVASSAHCPIRATQSWRNGYAHGTLGTRVLVVEVSQVHRARMPAPCESHLSPLYTNDRCSRIDWHFLRQVPLFLYKKIEFDYDRLSWLDSQAAVWN